MSKTSDLLDMKYITEVKPNTYRIHMRVGVSLDGKNLYYTKQVSNITLNEVKKIRDEMWKHKAEKTNIDCNVRVIDFARCYLTDHVYETHTGATFDGMESKIKNHIIPYLGNYKLKDVTPVKIQELIIYLKSKDSLRHTSDGEDTKISATTIRNIYNILRAMFSKAVELKLVESNPCTGITLPKRTPPSINVYTLEEINALIEAINQSDLSIQKKCIFILAMSTGMRRGEIGGLLKENIDWKNKVLKVRYSLSNSKSKGVELKNPKSNAGIRSIGLNDISIEMLKNHLNEQEKISKEMGDSWIDTPYVFTNEHGQPISLNSIGNAWRRFLKNHKLKYVKLHGLRASFATYLAYNGCTPKEIQTLLGHSSERIAMQFYETTYDDCATKIINVTNKIGKK